MSTNHDDRPDGSDQTECIEKLREQARQAAGGQMIAWESDELPAEQRKQFWRRVMDFENAPMMTDFERLADAGVELPDPGTVNDEQVTAKLWEVIHGLAAIRTFLRETDHLSDSELYEVLWRRVLREANPIIADDDDSVWHVGLLGSGDETDTHLYLKYYADERERQQWLVDFPDDVMPAHEDPPFNRDCLLPQPDDALPS